MTSVILTQKLLTMKLDKSEFDKVKWQQNDINQKKTKVVNSLKVILEQEHINKTCRLCLRPGNKIIFGGNQDYDICLNIKYILGIEISQEDGKPQHICKPCEIILRQASRLRQTAETTQWRLDQEQEMVSETPPNCSPHDTNRGGYFKVLDTEVAREWVCNKCRKAFDSQAEFSEHVKLPSCKAKAKVSSYVCETCGMELKTLSRLKRHRLTHTGELSFACTQCPYRARTKYALSVHERAHSGLRPLRCALCGAAFRSASALASHRRRHLPPRHVCARCHRAFTFRAALQNHIATQHSNAKPFSCGLCGKAFSTRKMILRHELKVHNRPKMRSGVLPTYMRQQEQLDT